MIPASYDSEVHYSDVIISAMVSQITGVTIVYSTVCLVADQVKTSKLRVTGLCEGNSPLIDEFPSQRAGNVFKFYFLSGWSIAFQ